MSSVTAWDRLQRLGCDVAQGYYLSKAVPGPEVAGLIAEADKRHLRSHPKHVMASPGLTIDPPVLQPDPGLIARA